MDAKTQQNQTHKNFVALVADMRRAQRAYFKTRDAKALGVAKNLEGRVDRYVEANQQPGLF